MTDHGGLRSALRALCALSVLIGIGLGALANRVNRESTSGRQLIAGASPVMSIRRIPTVLQTAIGAQSLQDEVSGILAKPDISGAATTSCVLVTVGRTTVVRERIDSPVIPASTLKLLTATAALSTMDPQTRFRTEVRATKPTIDSVLDGDLWLVGGGDPLLESAGYTATKKHGLGVATSLDRLADAVAATGLRSITGGIVGDDRLFDQIRVVPTWKHSYVGDGEVGPIGGLIVDDNFTVIDSKGRRTAATVVGVDAARSFQHLLELRGIAVANSPAAATATQPSASLVAPTAVALVESIPLEGVVAEMLRESDNTTAEALLKQIGLAGGGEGSSAAGVEALRRSLKLGGAKPDELRALHMVDGSGLDRSDNVTCRLLEGTVRDQPESGPLISGLAVMGQSGTLRERLRGSAAAGRVKAKTGTLNGVSALVGVTKSTDGRDVAFALVANGLASTASGVAAGDALASALVEFPRAPQLTALAPLGGRAS